MDEKIKHLHTRAVEAANLNRKSEADLLSILQEMNHLKGYFYFGATSLYDYCVRVLKLTEGTAYSLISVARKSLEVPALKEAVVKGEISVSKAKKIVSVINETNQSEWIELASKKTSREIEKAVVKVSPQKIQESLRYKTEDRLELKLGISEKLLKKLERVMDLESQRLSKAASREDAFEAALDLYLEKNDPLKKAERHFAWAKKQSRSPDVSKQSSSPRSTKLFPGTVRQPQRRPLSAKTNHFLELRDKSQCAHINKEGMRCSNTRWLHVHHIVPVAHGGTNEPDNLMTLCSAHHQLTHRSEKRDRSEQRPFG